MKRSSFIILVIIFSFLMNHLSAQELPSDFPVLYTEKSGETGGGYIFLSVSTIVEGIGYYVFMIDDDGNPVNYRKLENDYAYDFKVQPNGLMSYAQFLSHHSYTGGGNCIHMILDENMEVVDSFQMKNGYIAEAHDFQLLPNGHVLLFGYYLTQMDLSDLVDGGYPNALVSGGIVQELDQDKNVVWQWRSWDHYDPENYTFGRRSSNQIVSEFHLNTINLDRDDNMILATPSWTKKIDRQTGQILWHLGGDENEFSYVGVDSLEGVSDVTGHAFYRLENGNFLIYDNGPRRGAGTSEAHEYRIDEENLIAEKIRTFTPETDIAGWHRGNAQRLTNGNTLVGWGGARGEHIPTCTEFDSAGNEVLKVFFEDPALESYRAVRHPYPPEDKYYAYIENTALGNTYEMMQGDTLDTGVEIKVNELQSWGYNEMILQYREYAPRFPRFEERAPMVLAKSVILDHFAIGAIGGVIRFDPDILNIKNPERITVYFRENVGEGVFQPLPTNYNSILNELQVEFDQFGEYIFTYPDIEPVALRPNPVLPKDGALVNYQEPVKMEWAPDGFFDNFNLQISKDSGFTELILDTTGVKGTVIFKDDFPVNQSFFWRAKTINSAGESEWSDTAMFNVGAPFIDITSPNGGEVWQRGMRYFIEWEDNFGGNVILELFHNNELKYVVDTIENTNAYEWEIPENIDSACNYYVHIRSLEDSAIQSRSNQTFAINHEECNSEIVADLNIQSPNGGESYLQGDTIMLKWENTLDESVILRLLRGESVELELEAGATDTILQWIIPEDLSPGDNFRFMILSDGDLNLHDLSNGSFHIKLNPDVSALAGSVNNTFLKIYPNPAHDNFKVDFQTENTGKVTIQITKLDGSIVKQRIHKNLFPGEYSWKFSMEGNPPGIYIINYVDNTQSVSRLLIMQ
ncbi:MAG: aryl-sulfate sulfotransferase [Bacteroidales bacterium]